LSACVNLSLGKQIISYAGRSMRWLLSKSEQAR
jgi:hypothetical protein